MLTTEGDDDDSDIEDSIDVDVREEDEEEEDDDSIFGKSPAKKLLQIEKEQEKEVKSNSDNMVCILWVRCDILHYHTLCVVHAFNSTLKYVM